MPTFIFLLSCFVCNVLLISSGFDIIVSGVFALIISRDLKKDGFENKPPLSNQKLK